MKDVHRINYKWMRKAALQYRSASGIFGTSEELAVGKRNQNLIKASCR